VRDTDSCPQRPDNAAG